MMITISARCCARRSCSGALAPNYYGQFLNENAISRQKREYSKKGDCCKDIDQAKGRQIEEWPKPDQAGPMNSDPYRIKVHDVAVPPLPSCGAKWTGIVLTDDRSSGQQGYGYPQQQFDEYGNPIQQEEKEESWMDVLKGLFGRGKKDKQSEDQFSEVLLQGDMDLPSEGSLFGSAEIGARGVRDLFHNSAIVHPDYWKQKPEEAEEAGPVEGAALPRLSYHGRSKYKYAFHEPWKPLDRLALLAQAEKDDQERAAADRNRET